MAEQQKIVDFMKNLDLPTMPAEQQEQHQIERVPVKLRAAPPSRHKRSPGQTTRGACTFMEGLVVLVLDALCSQSSDAQEFLRLSKQVCLSIHSGAARIKHREDRNLQGLVPWVKKDVLNVRELISFALWQQLESFELDRSQAQACTEQAHTARQSRWAPAVRRYLQQEA